METALTPMEFSRRAKNLYADREAVVDGDLRFSYSEFLERCDRWSNALQKLGVKQGDRVAYICLLYTSPSPRDRSLSRMPSSA